MQQHVVTLCDYGIHAKEFFPELFPEEFENDEQAFNRACKEQDKKRANAKPLKVGWNIELSATDWKKVHQNLHSTIFNGKYIIKSVHIA